MALIDWMERRFSHRHLDRLAARMFPELMADGRAPEARQRVLLLQAGYTLEAIERERQRIAALMRGNAG